jgi:acyl carrier protein
VAPRAALEEQIAGIWSQILGLERISVHANFFDLGGHSLLATQVVSHVAAALGFEVPLRLLFERPTIARFAEGVDGISRNAGERRSAVAIRRSADQSPDVSGLSDAEVNALLHAILTNPKGSWIDA